MADAHEGGARGLQPRQRWTSAVPSNYNSKCPIGFCLVPLRYTRARARIYESPTSTASYVIQIRENSGFEVGWPPNGRGGEGENMSENGQIRPNESHELSVPFEWSISHS